MAGKAAELLGAYNVTGKTKHKNIRLQRNYNSQIITVFG
jgi:hypothetical protein